MLHTRHDHALSPTHLALLWLLRSQQIFMAPELLVHEMYGCSDKVSLLRFLRRSGLRAKAMHVQPERLMQIPMPTVALLSNGDAIVVRCVTSDDVQFIDPATLLPSTRPLPMFLSQWSGVVVLAAQRDTAARARTRLYPGRLITRFALGVNAYSEKALSWLGGMGIRTSPHARGPERS